MDKFLGDPRDPETRAGMLLNVLDGMADAWAVEVKLHELIGDATIPMKLNLSVPVSVREQFHRRMKEQIDAIVRQAFVEGAHQAVVMVQDAYRAAGLVGKSE